MSQRKATGPGSDRVVALTPFVRVRDTRRSVRFYEQLGFMVVDTFGTGDQLHWASLEAGPEGRIMLEHTHEPIDPARQGVLFYLFSHDLRALRDRLVAERIDVGAIVDGRPGPRWELTLIDPDGYTLMVAQIERDDP
jgi:catechol 2,3-dioxygenase-like lactoylglutathione lyase family enzyme